MFDDLLSYNRRQAFLAAMTLDIRAVRRFLNRNRDLRALHRLAEERKTP
jgi:hypothetical protein